MCVLLITIKFLFELSSRVLTFWHHEGRERGTERTIYNYVRGKYLEPRSCQVSWDWSEPCEVGQPMGFRVHVRASEQGRNLCIPSLHVLA